MEKIGVGSKQMAKFFQVIALVLIAAVLSGAQCADLCSFLSLKRQEKSAEAGKLQMPCHQKKATENSSPPKDQKCSHYELFVEKHTDSSAFSFAVIPIGALTQPVLSSFPLTIVHAHFPAVSPLRLSSILRI